MTNWAGKEKAALAVAFLIILVTFFVELALLPGDSRPPAPGRAAAVGVVAPGE